MQYKTSSAKETQKIAEQIISEHKSPKATKPSGAFVFLLQGDLGSGKTTFVQGAVSFLGGGTEVTSPTFVLEKIYPLKNGGGWKNLVHIDAYRFDDPSEAKVLRLPEIFADPTNIVFIEWPERLAGFLPFEAQKIYFKFIDAETREIDYD